MSFGPVIILTMSWTVNILNIHLLYSSGGELGNCMNCNRLPNYSLCDFPIALEENKHGVDIIILCCIFYFYLNPQLCVICEICPPSHWVSSGLVPGRARQDRPAFQLFFAETFPLFKSLVLVPLVLYSVLKKGQINAQLCVVGPALYYWWCKKLFQVPGTLCTLENKS